MSCVSCLNGYIDPNAPNPDPDECCDFGMTSMGGVELGCCDACGEVRDTCGNCITIANGQTMMDAGGCVWNCCVNACCAPYTDCDFWWVNLYGDDSFTDMTFEDTCNDLYGAGSAVPGVGGWKCCSDGTYDNRRCRPYVATNVENEDGELEFDPTGYSVDHPDVGCSEGSPCYGAPICEGASRTSTERNRTISQKYLIK